MQGGVSNEIHQRPQKPHDVEVGLQDKRERFLPLRLTSLPYFVHEKNY